jgi:hypothetical protein
LLFEKEKESNKTNFTTSRRKVKFKAAESKQKQNKSRDRLIDKKQYSTINTKRTATACG